MSKIFHKHPQFLFEKSTVIGDKGGNITITCKNMTVNFRVDSFAQAMSIYKCVQSIHNENIEEGDNLRLSVYNLMKENLSLHEKLAKSYEDLSKAETETVNICERFNTLLDRERNLYKYVNKID